ncbi:elongation of very long chain fatty acids protein 5-like [Phlebotomus papatasi]|uniref:elongation of very long chain fatty acids protein 5-like n=1 Tax=Phlebotomus papatasi TaxID=29031 RepID=UPI0024847154|nr:elongation of very long chain fatty acids protein 5-like [Phlebotomus papatasi]
MEYFGRYMDFINYIESFTDVRTRGWFMVNNSNVIILTTVAYLLLVRLGKRIMKKRQPFQLKKIILIYNICVAIASAYIMYELYMSTTLLKFSWFCSFKKPMDDSDPNEMRLATAIWLYYLTKYVETLDSFFFVLRKKNNQLSGLHLYHHSMMILYAGLTVKWYPVEMTYSPCMINSGVHVIMYIYYGLSTLGPSVARYLWWKKYLTLIQMVGPTH